MNHDLQQYSYFSEEPGPSKYNNDKDMAIFLKTLALVNIIIMIKILSYFYEDLGPSKYNNDKDIAIFLV